jgi:hypothetical protein
MHAPLNTLVTQGLIHSDIHTDIVRLHPSALFVGADRAHKQILGGRLRGGRILNGDECSVQQRAVSNEVRGIAKIRGQFEQLDRARDVLDPADNYCLSRHNLLLVPRVATRTHARTHAHAHAHAHSRTHTHTHARTQTHANARKRTHTMHAHARNARTRTSAHKRTQAHTSAHKRTQAHTSARTRTHAHAHARTRCTRCTRCTQ